MQQIREVDVEQKLIEKLEWQKYSYRPDIRDKAALNLNFRQKFEALNRVRLTEREYQRLQDEIITSDVFAAAKRLREKSAFERDDGTPLNYTLVNLNDWCKNHFEVINQLRINTDNSHHRYDVILLINGLPLVQIELKTLQISPRRAMAQIVDYKNEAGNGYTNSLLCFMQLFIVSNQSDTFYFANNRNEHFNFNAEERFLPVYQHADETNNKITHIDLFTNVFLHKCTLGQLLSRYMVLVASEKKILVMRPYQIYAVKAIVDCIHQNRGNGYIWHTTGSGKTLTSFKASTLLKSNPDIDKCLFVVDRKDLDRQTREEFNKFQPGCVEQNTNTEMLVRRLLSEDYADKVIVTTIQKLGLALDENSKRNQAKRNSGQQSYKDLLAPLREKRLVFIFDECHRSQFGENHQLIKNFFPKAQLFGFTGTPIFESNASYSQIEGDIKTLKTTAAVFENELHTYTITNAIDDRNVLSFHIDYFGQQTGNNTSKPKTGTPPPAAVVKEILTKHDSATSHRQFNAILATASINDAINYYEQFNSQQQQQNRPLNIACVFSPPAEGDQDVQQLQEDLLQEKADNQHQPEAKKAALQNIIARYNSQYGTNHSINEFDSYYQDVQKRIKDHKYPNSDYPQHNKIDIVIVVDMLLTGFDSQYLNTLYVDKNLKYHSLIQAFSRTNRVLNDSKPWGNILDFRGQQNAVDEAIALFSGADAEQAKEIWLVDPAPKVIAKLHTAVADLQTFMQTQDLAYEPAQVNNLKGDQARAAFVNKFKEIQRISTQLNQYTDLNETSRQQIETILPQNTQREFKAQYLETAKRLQARQQQPDAPDEIQQLDFEFVLFNSTLIDYDYIMELIAKSTQSGTSKEQMTRQQLTDWISSDAKFIDERDNIIAYINSLPLHKSLNADQIRCGYQQFKNDKNAAELAAIASNHGLGEPALTAFVEAILERMIFDGEKLTDLMEPFNLGWRERRQKELALMAELIPLLKKLAEGQEISGLGVYE